MSFTTLRRTMTSSPNDPSGKSSGSGDIYRARQRDPYLADRPPCIKRIRRGRCWNIFKVEHGPRHVGSSRSRRSSVDVAAMRPNIARRCSSAS
ncbi:hypothetical protein, partial [Bradyrhizobium sp.]|uniref:hypothetical protein n=1 Tax=Bradyrhizobium sp. TaxID=376 RepID=UPI002901DFA9